MEWMEQWPTMCILSINKFKWTSETETSFRMLIEDTNSVANSIDKITKEYELVMTQLKQPLTNIQRTKVISLLADKH